MLIRKKVLCDLIHLISFSLAFNRLNAMLNKAQTSHFERAGKDILSIRDPFIPYTEGAKAQQTILALCGASTLQEMYSLHQQDDTLILIDDPEWVIDTIQQAIRFYKERHLFFMLDTEYDDDLNLALGEEGATSFKGALHEILNKHLVCGCADDSVSSLIYFLQSQGKTYTPPPAPYMEKHTARFAEFIAMVRASLAKT